MNRSGHPFLVVCSILLLAGIAGIVGTRGKSVELLEHPGLRPVGYDDRADGRASRSEVGMEPGSTVWDWRLDPAPGNSYAGILFEPRDHELFDGSGWDSLRITWESDKGTPVRVTLQTDQPGLTVHERPLSRRYLQLEAVPPKKREIRSFALNDFRPPAWWFRENHQPISETRQFLDRCVGIALENGETAQPGAGDRVRIASLEFVKAPPSSGWAVALCVLAISGAAAGAVFRRRQAPSSPLQAPPSVRLEPAPLDTPPSRAEVVRSWLETHYHEPEVSLEGLAQALGLGPDSASKEIRKHFQDTFKGVVNRLRLQEARRLLADSDLGIAEIAFKVGYGTVPHFNRLAKEAWGRTPTEERAALRGESRPT